MRRLLHHPGHYSCIVPGGLRTNHYNIRRKHGADIRKIFRFNTATVRNQNLREERLYVGTITDDRYMRQCRPLLGVGGFR